VSNSVTQESALVDARKLKEEGRRRVDSEEGLVWAVTRRRHWSEWIVYVASDPRPRRVATVKSSDAAIVQAVVDALEPFEKGSRL